MKSVIFISPHFDDICFSLASMALGMQVPHKKIINIFTNSGWASNPEIKEAVQNLDPSIRDATVNRLRDEEDSAFAQSAGLEKINFNFTDPSLLAPKGHPAPAQFYDGVESEIDAVYERLFPLLRDHLAQEEETVFVAPLAIGLHRNHLVTFSVMVKMAEDLNAQLMFYEDLPYACEPHKRLERLAQVEGFLKSQNYQRYRKDMDEAAYLRKLKEVVKYKSQMNRTLEAYAIRTPECPERHEALWSNAGVEIVSSLF